MQRVTERGSRLSQKLVFVDLELAAAPDEAAAAWLADPAIARWRHWLEVVRMYRPHLLSEPEEKILTEKAVTGRNAWDRFFDETLGAARFDLDGEKLTRDQVLNRLYSPDRALRQRAAASVTAGLKEAQRTNTFIFNTILADKASDDRLRNYPTWISARNLANEVDDRTVAALVAAVTARYDIVARYYRLKRRLLGLDELLEYDRYAPLPAADRHYTWDEARDTVLNAYARFAPRLAEIAGWFFDRRWIDAAVKPGKMGGAFSAGTVPSVHPYVLMNYEGRPRDVMTLAHELGHGVHQKLAGVQGMLQAHTPLTTAETASVFGEMLVFQDLMARETDPAVRLGMLTGKIEDSFATAFRQISMNRFEHAIHTARRQEGELATERFNELWLETQRAMFGDSVTLTDEYGAVVELHPALHRHARLCLRLRVRGTARAGALRALPGGQRGFCRPLHRHVNQGRRGLAARNRQTTGGRSDRPGVLGERPGYSGRPGGGSRDAGCCCRSLKVPWELRSGSS